MDTPDCTEFIILLFCKFGSAKFNLANFLFNSVNFILTIFFWFFKHLCWQNQAYWHVQFPKFAIEVFFLWNFANHLKVRDFANLCIHSNSLLLHPSLILRSSFYGKQASAFRILFAKRPQGLCKICCGNLSAVAADIRKSFGFEKSK